MITILKNLWLNNGNKSILLTNWTISCKNNSSLCDWHIWRKILPDLEDSPPFGESAPHLIILSTPLSKTIKPLSSRLVISTSNHLKTCVNLDTTVDSSRSKNFAEFGSIFAIVSYCFIVHNNTADEFFNVWSSKKKLSIILPIFMIIFNPNCLESLANSSSRLICSQDTLAFSTNIFASLN